MAPSQNDRGEFLRTEYVALSQYFGTVIIFRFTTVSFFIAAVALVLGLTKPETHHYLLLLALSLGIWIVELRNRALSDGVVLMLGAAIIVAFAIYSGDRAHSARYAGLRCSDRAHSARYVI